MNTSPSPTAVLERSQPSSDVGHMPTTVWKLSEDADASVDEALATRVDDEEDASTGVPAATPGPFTGRAAPVPPRLSQVARSNNGARRPTWGERKYDEEHATHPWQYRVGSVAARPAMEAPRVSTFARQVGGDVLLAELLTLGVQTPEEVGLALFAGSMVGGVTGHNTSRRARKTMADTVKSFDALTQEQQAVVYSYTREVARVNAQTAEMIAAVAQGASYTTDQIASELVGAPVTNKQLTSSQREVVHVVESRIHTAVIDDMARSAAYGWHFDRSDVLKILFNTLDTREDDLSPAQLDELDRATTYIWLREQPPMPAPSDEVTQQIDIATGSLWQTLTRQTKHTVQVTGAQLRRFLHGGERAAQAQQLALEASVGGVALNDVVAADKPGFAAQTRRLQHAVFVRADALAEQFAQVLGRRTEDGKYEVNGRNIGLLMAAAALGSFVGNLVVVKLFGTAPLPKAVAQR